MNKIIKYIFGLSIFSLVLLGVNSCSCPLDEETISVSCVVREATITKFKPALVSQIINLGNNKFDTVLIPGPEYNVHTFVFPSNNSTTGILTNDDRFSNKDFIAVYKIPFSDKRPYYLAVIDETPSNSDMNGDLMVSEVDPINFSYADVRISGKISQLAQTFNNDDSKAFCDFVRTIKQEDIDRYDAVKEDFGSNLPDSKKIFRNYNSANIVTLDKNGNIAPNIKASTEDSLNALANISNKVLDIRMNKGEVYFLKTRANKRFIFAVTDIRNGNPYKRKMSIIFSPVN